MPDTNSESPKIKKTSTILIDEAYNTPNTSLIVFDFIPYPCASSEERLQNCSIHQASIDGRDLYIFDGFFQEEEGKQMQEFSEKATFSRNSYGSSEAVEKGEKPARSMNGKERWQFFSRPPEPIKAVCNLLGTLAHHLEAEITTLPWELCDSSLNGSPSVIGNFLEEMSFDSMKLGKHRDCNPQKKISFGIPILYSQDKQFCPTQFVNGDPGKPWLISVMLYVTDEAFNPEYCMGTVFYKEDGQLALRANCLNMRLIFFEGDIIHSIEESKIPSNVNTWRVSYVFKLVVNPRRQDQSTKRLFSEWVNQLPVGSLRVQLGDSVRI
jgi:hypothetical protein